MQQPTFPHTFRFPAEWEAQEAIMLTWPHPDTDWEPYLMDITATYIQLASVITRFEHLLVVTPYPEIVSSMLSNELSDTQLNRIHLFCADTDDTWARDHGPITLIREDKNGLDDFHLLDFKFNGWGEKFAWEQDNAINRALYLQGAFKAEMEDHTDFVLEGGSIESDGKGTVFTTSQCLLAPHRNQPLSKAGIEEQLKTRLYAQQIVWLDYGNLIGDDTDGHIDTIVRVAPHETLLYVGCDDPQDEQYEDFQALEDQLELLTTPEGAPYRILKLPMPDAIYDEGSRLSTNKTSSGDRLPATYANFLILNGAVIYPTYNQPEKDLLAKEQIQRAFPDREIIGIESLTIIRQHGSIHCLTMQLPQGILQD